MAKKKLAVKKVKPAKLKKVKLNIVNLATQPPAEPEAPEVNPDVSHVPKNYMIRCPKCRWGRTTSGVKADLMDLNEIHNSITAPGRDRRFTCPSCGNHAIMKKITRDNTVFKNIEITPVNL